MVGSSAREARERVHRVSLLDEGAEYQAQEMRSGFEEKGGKRQLLKQTPKFGKNFRVDEN